MSEGHTLPASFSSWACGLLKSSLFPHETVLKKAKFSFVSGYQMQLASGLGMGGLCLLLLSALGSHTVHTHEGPVHAASVSL